MHAAALGILLVISISGYAQTASGYESKVQVSDSGQLILDALKSDPYGIAISNPHYAGAEVKAVALSVGGGSQTYPTKEEVASGRYPLARAVYIFFNREADQTLNPRIREFLRYVLSSEGQQEVLREGAYLPLPENVRRKQLEKIP